MIKKIVLTALIFSILQVGNSQIVNSTCDAPDSVSNIYKEDAYRLSLRKIMNENLTYKDSVIIPFAMVDSVLRPFMAIYNASIIPEVDTIVNLLHIHSQHFPFMDEVIFNADSNLFWMQRLRQGDTLSGYPELDTLIVKYNLRVTNYIAWPMFSHHLVKLSSDSLYNTWALSDKLNSIQGIFWAEDNGSPIDGNNITCEYYSMYYEFTFSYGWDDCLSGCICKRFWKFNVYFDCSVEFVESWGTQLPNSIIDLPTSAGITISPNPFDKYLEVKPFTKQTTYMVTDMHGKEIISGQIENGIIKNLDNLQEGVYLLKLYDGKNTSMTKILKSSR